jgi:hypothetical protein
MLVVGRARRGNCGYGGECAVQARRAAASKKGCKMNRHQRRAAVAQARTAGSMNPTINGYQVAIRKIEPREADQIRADEVRLLLRHIVVGLKPRLHPAQWQNCAWPELESFVEALCSGGMHPALTEWQVAKDNAGHPALSSRELNARRLAVLMYEALKRVEAFPSKLAAREFVAAKLANTGVLDHAPTAKVIEHWQRRDHPSLAPGDELLLATGIATAGRDPQKLALYFLGLWHLADNPTAVIVRDDALEIHRT